MPTIPLPDRPNLEHLRGQARELQRAARAGIPAALELVAEHHPRPPVASTLSLTAAQTTVARRYGFADWARLRRHVELIAARTWVLTDPPTGEGPADEFLRLACLTFEQDDPGRWLRAARLLGAHPELPSTSVPVAAACADAVRLGRLLAADPAAATRTGGPFGWSPLLYLAYARHDGDLTGEATLAAARLLIDHGADPDDGRFFLGLPTPFTVLTGVFGGDPVDQPPHPQAGGLARLLLEAGADPNDGQALYNRMFGRDDSHLELLFEFGLGARDDGYWRGLLGDQLESPQTMLRSLLDWAVTHDQRERVALLARHGVDVVTPITVRRRSSRAKLTPIEVALLNGHLALTAELRDLGAVEPRLNAVQAFVSAALSGDAEGVSRTPAGVVAAAKRARPGLVVWAASLGRVAAVDLLVGAGFDVNALGRGDTPIEQRWQTALHTAAGEGDLAMARRLLELGADPDLRDRRYDGTPLDWARFFSRPSLVELLTPLTRPADPAGRAAQAGPNGTGAT